MATQQDIDKLAERLSRVNSQLTDARKVLDDEIAALVKRNGAGLKKLVAIAAEIQAELVAAIDKSPDLFVKPKTQTLHGWRLGFRKDKDEVIIADPEKTVELIELRLPDQAAVLIKTEKKPIVKALEQLDDEQLRKVGCRRKTGDDAPWIAPAASDVDKLIAAMVRKAMEEVEA